MLPPELPLLQEVASSARAADNSPLSDGLHEEGLQSKGHEPAGNVPVGRQEPQVSSCAVFLTAL